VGDALTQLVELGGTTDLEPALVVLADPGHCVRTLDLQVYTR